jgi:hypothetical protein
VRDVVVEDIVDELDEGDLELLGEGEEAKNDQMTGDIDVEFDASTPIPGMTKPQILRKLDSTLNPVSTEPLKAKRSSSTTQRIELEVAEPVVKPKGPAPAHYPTRTKPDTAVRKKAGVRKGDNLARARQEEKLTAELRKAVNVKEFRIEEGRTEVLFNAADPPSAVRKVGRGRPRKYPMPSILKGQTGDPAFSPLPNKRGRGRPRKAPIRVLSDVTIEGEVNYSTIDTEGLDQEKGVSAIFDRLTAELNHVATTDESGGNIAPTNHREAHSRPDKEEWLKAEEKEVEGLITQAVFEWRDRGDVPPQSRVLSTRFVYDFKTNERNEIIKYKARLVVRGFQQRAGIEYGETFSATVRAKSLRTVLSIAARERMRLHQFDVEQAFLTADIGAEAIYVHPPPGYERKQKVWRLRKALYGLKQASHLFQKHFSTLLTTQLGMKQLKSDQSIYVMTRTRGNGKVVKLIACVYVDDIVVAYGDDAILREFKLGLENNIRIKDMGQLKYCLGMHVVQDPVTYSVTITQTGFIQDLLDRTGLGSMDVWTRVTPAKPGERLSSADCPQDDGDKREMMRAPYNSYRSIVGSLMYLTGATRPDIGYAVNQLSRFVANPGKRHWEFLEHLLRYLAGTRDLGIHYCGNKVQGVILEDEKQRGYWGADARPQPQLLSESFKNNLILYADADWGSDLDTRRSTTGWVAFMNGGPISWRVKRQSTVATSTAEAELYALGDGIKEVQSLQKLLYELGYEQPQRRPGRGGDIAEPDSVKNRGTVIFEDNVGCIHISQNDVFHNRTKHISIQYHFVLEAVANGDVCITHVPTDQQVADVLTKAVAGPTLERLRSKLMGLWVNPYARRQ